MKIYTYRLLGNINIAVSLFCPDEALAGEYNGPEDAIVQDFLSMTACIASCL